MKSSIVRVSLVCFLATVPLFSEPPAVGTTQIFAALKGRVAAGIICDDKGHMFVAKNGELMVIAPDGTVSPFVNLADLPKGKDYYFASPLIWDMTFDGHGNIVAAAQDRILRIAPDGSVSTLVREDFEGSMGACGVALDRDGNMYVGAGSKVYKYTPRMEKSVFIDWSKSTPSLTWEGMTFDLALKTVISLCFDPRKENLYASELDSSTLLRYPLRTDGSAGPPTIVFDSYTDDLSQAPLNVLFGDKGSLFASNDLSSQILRIDRDGKKSVIRIPGRLRNHWIAFGGRGFEEDCLYFTTIGGDFVYKTYVGERAARTGY